jgi:hypothetical protein
MVACAAADSSASVLNNCDEDRGTISFVGAISAQLQLPERLSLQCVRSKVEHYSQER